MKLVTCLPEQHYVAVGRQLHDSVTQAVNKMSETITIESGNNYAPPFKDELCKAFDCSKDIAVTLRAEIERLTIGNIL